MSFVPGQYYYTADVGEADSVIANLGSGDVCILEEGTHVVTEPIPDNVVIRGRAGKQTTTILECADLAVGAFATIRGVTIRQTGGNAALTTGGGVGMRWVEDCAFDCTYVVFETGEDWTFSKCAGEGVINSAGGDLTVNGCSLSAVLPSAAVDGSFSGGLVHVYNNTFAGAAPNGVPIVQGGLADDRVYNNVFNVTGANTAVIGASSGTLYGNWSTYNLGNASWGTVAADLKLRANGYPTNESPVRIAATPQTGDSSLDLNYLPYGSARSAGCYQWFEDASALYIPRYVDPLDGFALEFDSATLDLAPGRLTLHDHLEMAAYMRSYVNDLVHPSFGAFYTSPTGAYRLTTWDGDPFDLTITGESASVFGATSLSAVDDTG